VAGEGFLMICFHLGWFSHTYQIIFWSTTPKSC